MPLKPPPNSPPKSLAVSGMSIPQDVAEKSKAPFLGKRERIFLPPRIVLNTVEGWGKTSLAAYAPQPAILMAREETGYLTLLGANRVPSVANAHINYFGELMALLRDLAALDNLPCKTIVLDALSGFDKLCQEYICERDFGNSMKEYGKWGAGTNHSVNEWCDMVNLLSKINSKGVIVLLLAHYKIGTAPNPEGDEYQKFLVDLKQQIWSITHRWADAVLFGDYLTATKEDKSHRIKAIGGKVRTIQTEHTATVDAKNRYGLPTQITVPDDPAQSWPTLWNTITEAIANGKEKE